MAKQSEAEWLRDQITATSAAIYCALYDHPKLERNLVIAKRILAALRRRGWRPPEKRKGK